MHKNCVVCGRPDSDVHHIKTRGSGGTDDPWNLVHLCRREHAEIHQIGSVRFTKKYINFFEHISKKGWYIDGNKLRNVNNEL